MNLSTNKGVAIGTEAERAAEDYLCALGMRCLARNYCTRVGEIDLILQDQDLIVFVEVRYRNSSTSQSALESIGPIKRRRVIKTAAHYLQSKRWTDSKNCRFDVVTVRPAAAGLTCNWIKDAFRP